MKIIAHFDSADSADFAAGALKNALSPLASIETKDYSDKNNTDNTHIIAAFNTATSTPNYSTAAISYSSSNDRRKNYENDYISAKHVLEVVCQSEDAAKASRIIIGHGGRNITKL